MDEKYSQTPQVVPQAFSNIAKPGYRSDPAATVQQKELVKLEYMAHKNMSIANFLSTFFFFFLNFFFYFCHEQYNIYTYDFAHDYET